MIHKNQELASVIIGNENFDEGTDLCQLTGVPVDVRNVKEFLSLYGIHSNVDTDVDAEDIKRILQRLSKRDFSKYSGLIVTIITHGKEGNTLFGKDGKDVELKELAKLFNSAKCKGLKDKPKIFIINACRGGKQDAVILGPEESPSVSVCK